MKYEYSVVRFVPYPIRGEFVNVAIIVGSEKTGEWAIRSVENWARGRRLEKGKRLTAAQAYLESVKKLIGEDQPQLASHRIGSGWLAGEYRRLRNLVQLSEPATVVAADVQDALNEMFDLFIADPVKINRETRQPAVNALRDAFGRINLQSARLHERVTAMVGSQSVPVDFAVANGHLVQLAHAWSFREREPRETVQQVKAWSWTLRDLRDYGGMVRTQGKRKDYPVDRDVEIGITYVTPVTDKGRRSLDEALEVFEHLKVRAVSTDDAYKVAEDAAEALARGTDNA
jgi:hypothetical protein